MKIPADVLSVLEAETNGLDFGEVSLSVFLRDGHPRYEVTRKKSIIPATHTLGVGNPCNTRNYGTDNPAMRNEMSKGGKHE
jgi:hypothetical protein